jgi:DTW domain-containing protein YfiP
MSTRRSTQNIRCKRCRVHPTWCFCDAIIEQELHNTHLTIIRHAREKMLPSGTARLAELSLTPCEIIEYGSLDSNIDENLKLDPDMKQLYLFPCEDSKELSQVINKTDKIQLIVPDGSWRQTKKFKRRINALKDIQAVHINKTNPLHYKLRKQESDEGMCTLEAIAYALSYTERPEIKDSIFKTLDAMNNSFQFSRDIKSWHQHLKKIK